MGNNPKNSFFGSSRYSLDDKFRLSIPVEYRKKLSPEADGKFVILPGIDFCLFVYPLNEWQDSILSRVRDLKLNEQDYLRYTRWLFGNAVECAYDVQGRIRIPSHLMEYGKLTQNHEVLVVGMGDYIEVWNPEEYTNYSSEQGFDYQAAHRKLIVGMRPRNDSTGSIPQSGLPIPPDGSSN